MTAKKLRQTEETAKSQVYLMSVNTSGLVSETLAVFLMIGVRKKQTAAPRSDFLDGWKFFTTETGEANVCVACCQSAVLPLSTSWSTIIHIILLRSCLVRRQTLASKRKTFHWTSFPEVLIKALAFFFKRSHSGFGVLISGVEQDVLCGGRWRQVEVGVKGGWVRSWRLFKSLLSPASRAAKLPGLRCRISNAALGQRRAVFVRRRRGDGLLMRLGSSRAELTLWLVSGFNEREWGKRSSLLWVLELIWGSKRLWISMLVVYGFFLHKHEGSSFTGVWSSWTSFGLQRKSSREGEQIVETPLRFPSTLLRWTVGKRCECVYVMN